MGSSRLLSLLESASLASVAYVYIFKIVSVYSGQGGLAAAFDLAAYEGYMIARVKKFVNQSESYRACAKQVFHFYFGAILDFLVHGRIENVYKIGNLTPICSPLSVFLWK